MNEQRAHEVVEHLQTAALEIIEAARAFLDVAEELVQGPRRGGGDGLDPGQPVPPVGPHLPEPSGGPAGVEHIRVS